MARLAFARKQFDRCLIHLEKIDHTKITHSQKARFLSIACHYEQKLSSKVIKANCQAYISFVKRQFAHKLELQVGSINFCKIVIEITSPKPDKSKIDSILQNEQYIVFKDWLVEKVKNRFE